MKIEYRYTNIAKLQKIARYFGLPNLDPRVLSLFCQQLVVWSDQPLTKKPEDSGIEIAVCETNLLWPLLSVSPQGRFVWQTKIILQYYIYIQFSFLCFPRFAVRISLLSTSSSLNNLLVQVFERSGTPHGFVVLLFLFLWG